MLSNPKRDFFLQANPLAAVTDAQLVDGFRYVADLERHYSEAERHAAVVALVTSSAFRWSFFGQLRNCAWILRAGRSYGNDERLNEAAEEFALSVQLLIAAGFDLVAVRQLCACLSNSCTCDGCDLFDGRRFGRLAQEIETPATVGAVRGHGREDVLNEPSAVSNERPAS